MYIRLTLVKSLIVESIKNETYQRGKLVKTPAATGTPGSAQAISQAYHETAGDETYHERMIERSIVSNLADFKTRISDYLTQTGQTAADNITQTTDGDSIILTLSVSDRFNTSHTDDLAKLASEYIVNASLMDWYRPIDDNRAKIYAAYLERNITAAIRCFSKTAPKVPQYNYPTAITMRYPIVEDRNGWRGMLSSSNNGDAAIDPVILYNNPWHVTRGDRTEISYTLTGENGEAPLDDIVVRCDNPCCIPCVSPDGQWRLEAKKPGFTIVTLFSRHDDRVFAKFAVRVVG